MYDPFVYSTVTATMAALQRHVAFGHHYYVTGEVPLDKAAALCQKFHERFDLLASSTQRSRARRKHNRASFRLILWPIAGSLSLRYWLIRTDGDHPLLRLETWRDARVDRLQWLWDYELVRMPVPGHLRQRYQRPSGKVAIRSVTWTWRFRRDVLNSLRADIRRYAQHHDSRMEALIRSVHAAPGFRQIRDDVWRLDGYIHRQFNKRKRPCPELPPVPRPETRIRGRSDRTYPLSYLVRRHQRGCESWFPRSSTRRDTSNTPSTH